MSELSLMLPPLGRKTHSLVSLMPTCELKPFNPKDPKGPHHPRFTMTVPTFIVYHRSILGINCGPLATMKTTLLAFALDFLQFNTKDSQEWYNLLIKAQRAGKEFDFCVCIEPTADELSSEILRLIPGSQLEVNFENNQIHLISTPAQEAEVKIIVETPRNHSFSAEGISGWVRQAAINSSKY
jgi:hypothetical protein